MGCLVVERLNNPIAYRKGMLIGSQSRPLQALLAAKRGRELTHLHSNISRYMEPDWLWKFQFLVTLLPFYCVLAVAVSEDSCMKMFEQHGAWLEQNMHASKT